MLYVCTDITRFSEFKTLFQEQNQGLPFLDLSKARCSELAGECKSIVSHHNTCAVFLGYLEPGWMIEPTHQTLIRSVLRKFPTAMVSNFVESISYSWKNEIATVYTHGPLNKNGHSNSINDGCSL